MAIWAKFKGSVPDKMTFRSPNRDLTDEDKAQMTEDEIREVEESPLFYVRPERRSGAERADDKPTERAESKAETTKKVGE